MEDIVKYWSLGREVTISETESPTSHGNEKPNDGKQNAQDKESEREVKGKTKKRWEERHRHRRKPVKEKGEKQMDKVWKRRQKMKVNYKKKRGDT